MRIYPKILYNDKLFLSTYCLSLVRFRNGAFRLNGMLGQKRIYIVGNGNAENNGSYLGCAFSGGRKKERTEEGEGKIDRQIDKCERQRKRD